MAAKTKRSSEIAVPPAHDWRTSDQDEINKRRIRAREEIFAVTNPEPRHPVFSNFRVRSGSGSTYSVEIRDLGGRLHHCECVDFRINGLGTCKHVEAVLLHLEDRFRRHFRAAHTDGSRRLEVVLDRDRDRVRILKGPGPLPAGLKKWFEADGRLRGDSPETAVAALQELRRSKLPELRISQEIAPWLENRHRTAERTKLRRAYELNVQSGQWPVQETRVPLFPYQREGMLHLAFTERALLADEMGLGKTIQAIAACALLHRLGLAQRALIVTPASLKTEWEEQIRQFTSLPHQLVFGPRRLRLKAYQEAPFFTVVNYEQMLADALEVNAGLQPQIVVLDEAQRIKNWGTQTAQAIKRLRSRYAFVLTGTPIENRIDELHSLMDFLDPAALGPLFRFNRDFYQLDDRGRPCGYRNLDQLHERIRPYMLRRRKADVETELPERTDRHHFVPLSATQQAIYAEHERPVAALLHTAHRRPLLPREQQRLLRELAMMRMICDTNYILDPEDRECPKLDELEKILEECRENDAKVIVFSEWERMLELVRDLCQRLKLGHAWHTGSVPQVRRRTEINRFKNDPACRVFLSTDSGSTGLNLQNASVVINCDLPWNPAKLEQRIARAWRKNQTRPVTVIHLVAENTLEHRMLGTLANKQALADGVLDLRGNLQDIKMGGGSQAFLAKLRLLVPETPPATPSTAKPSALPATSLPSDRPLAFAQRAREIINGSLLHCEERFPATGASSLLLVVVDENPALHRPRLESLHAEFFGPTPADSTAPVSLHVIDRATAEALQRLMEAGLITKTDRASRSLFPPTTPTAPPPLSDEQRQHADALREKARHSLRRARVLGPAGFLEETRSSLLESALLLGQALAVENRLPEPASLNDALLPPLSRAWKAALPDLQTFTSNPAHPWLPTLQILEQL